eukprot:scaffold923_cov256-Pinguiococcus_pyrenoidosus.AAC.4
MPEFRRCPRVLLDAAFDLRTTSMTSCSPSPLGFRTGHETGSGWQTVPATAGRGEAPSWLPRMFDCFSSASQLSPPGLLEVCASPPVRTIESCKELGWQNFRELTPRSSSFGEDSGTGQDPPGSNYLHREHPAVDHLHFWALQRAHPTGWDISPATAAAPATKPSREGSTKPTSARGERQMQRPRRFEVVPQPPAWQTCMCDIRPPCAA